MKIALSACSALFIGFGLLAPVAGFAQGEKTQGEKTQEARKAGTASELRARLLAAANGQSGLKAVDPDVTLTLSEGLAKYLELKPEQRTKIQQNNQEVLLLVLKNSQRQSELYATLEQELGKPQLDAALIGQSYAEAENLRRQMVAAETKARTLNVEVLTPAQKLLLKTFEDALRNESLIDEASCQALLAPVVGTDRSFGGGSPSLMPGAFTPTNSDPTPLCGLRYATFFGSDFTAASK